MAHTQDAQRQIGTLFADTLVGRRVRFPLTDEPDVIHTVRHVNFCLDGVLQLVTDEDGGGASIVECDLTSPVVFVDPQNGS